MQRLDLWPAPGKKQKGAGVDPDRWMGWLRVEWWDNGGGGEGETGKAGIKEVASHANLRLRAGLATHVAELLVFLFLFFF